METSSDPPANRLFGGRDFAGSGKKFRSNYGALKREYGKKKLDLLSVHVETKLPPAPPFPNCAKAPEKKYRIKILIKFFASTPLRNPRAACP